MFFIYRSLKIENPKKNRVFDSDLLVFGCYDCYQVQVNSSDLITNKNKQMKNVYKSENSFHYHFDYYGNSDRSSVVNVYNYHMESLCSLMNSFPD